MRRTWKAGLSLFKIRAAEGLQYRLAALSGATISIFWALIEVVILSVFFRYGAKTADSVNSLTLAQGVSYVWLGQLMVMLQMPGVDTDLHQKITNGDIGIELCRPLDLYWHWFARSAAGKVNTFALRGGLVVVCGTLLTLLGFDRVGLGAPQSFLHFALFLVSVFSAFLFSGAWSMFLTSIRIPVTWGDGPINLITVTGSVLSGTYLPLQLWPDAMQSFLKLQPFASFLDTPARLFVGTVPIKTGLLSILLQLVWTCAFVLLGKLIMQHGLKSVIVQGG
ncbi:MAG: hypothetical protein LBS36_01930 [Oscillospiraceae bacterium]|jgi:ABC-2 type transport system permease protein|nr:hypothetical protein [Oscillospiraceae bacterium]